MVIWKNYIRANVATKLRAQTVVALTEGEVNPFQLARMYDGVWTSVGTNASDVERELTQKWFGDNAVRSAGAGIMRTEYSMVAGVSIQAVFEAGKKVHARLTKNRAAVRADIDALHAGESQITSHSILLMQDRHYGWGRS